MSSALVKANGITMRFGGVTAVNSVDLEVNAGEIVGIMGPNGAGKSTLLSMLSGARRPSDGQLEVCGKSFNQISPGDAAHAGVGLAHQIPKPFRKLTVRQNLEVASFVMAANKRKQAIEAALEITGLKNREGTVAGSLGLLELKRLEMARVLALDPKLILLDEVAAGLNGTDLRELIELVRKIHAMGKTIILVEHVQEVIHELAERVVVLEWGQKLMEGTPEQVANDPRVIEIYLGVSEEIKKHQRHSIPEDTVPRLQVDDLVAGYGPVDVLHHVALKVRPGEIFAVVGSNGAGKSTLAKTIAGMNSAKSGTLKFEGSDITKLESFRRMRAGLSLVPEGRRLFADLSVRENLQLGLRSSKNETPLDFVYELFPKLVELGDRRAGALSGGEQQMVAIGRALASEPKLVIFDELSLGLAPIIVDRMLAAVEKIAEKGISVVLIEQSVNKSLAMADTVLVLRRGWTVYLGSPEGFSEEKLHSAYLGVIEEK